MAIFCKSNLERHGNCSPPTAFGSPGWGVNIVVSFLKIAHIMYFHNLQKISLISLWSGSNSRRNNGFISNLNILHLFTRKWQHCFMIFTVNFRLSVRPVFTMMQ